MECQKCNKETNSLHIVAKDNYLPDDEIKYEEICSTCLSNLNFTPTLIGIALIVGLILILGFVL
jgi:hypothetical protein